MHSRTSRSPIPRPRAAVATPSIRIVAASGSSTSLNSRDPSTNVTVPTTLPSSSATNPRSNRHAPQHYTQLALIELVASIAERAVGLDHDLAGQSELLARNIPDNQGHRATVRIAPSRGKRRALPSIDSTLGRRAPTLPDAVLVPPRRSGLAVRARAAQIASRQERRWALGTAADTEVVNRIAFVIAIEDFGVGPAEAVEPVVDGVSVADLFARTAASPVASPGRGSDKRLGAERGATGDPLARLSMRRSGLLACAGARRQRGRLRGLDGVLGK